MTEFSCFTGSCSDTTDVPSPGRGNESRTWSSTAVRVCHSYSWWDSRGRSCLTPHSGSTPHTTLPSRSCHRLTESSLCSGSTSSHGEKECIYLSSNMKIILLKIGKNILTSQILTTIREHTLLGFNISILYKYGNKILYNFSMIFQILELKERDSLTGVVWFYFHCFCLCLSLANLLSLSLSSMVMLVLVLWTPGTTTCPRWSGSSHSLWWPLTSGKELYLNTSQPLTVQYVINRPISRSVTAVSRTHSMFVSLSVIGSGDGRKFIMTWCR